MNMTRVTPIRSHQRHFFECFINRVCLIPELSDTILLDDGLSPLPEFWCLGFKGFRDSGWKDVFILGESQKTKNERPSDYLH